MIIILSLKAMVEWLNRVKRVRVYNNSTITIRCMVAGWYMFWCTFDYFTSRLTVVRNCNSNFIHFVNWEITCLINFKHFAVLSINVPINANCT